MSVGPCFLNSIYQLATEAVQDKLREEGIVMSLPASSGELWDRDTAVVTMRGHDHCKNRVSCITMLKKFWVFSSWTMAATKFRTNTLQSLSKECVTW